MIGQPQPIKPAEIVAKLRSSFAAQQPVLDRQTTPPGAPSAGDRYLVTATATGDWAGEENAIAHYTSTGWSFYAPAEGWRTYVADEDLHYVYTGAAWVDEATLIAGSIDHGGLAGLGDDDHPIYSLADGSRAFTAAVAGVTPTLAAHLTTKAYVDGLIVGLYDHKGGYDAATNTPDLDTAPSGIRKGDAYTVSAAGTFFTEDLEVGDVLIADQDDPTVLTHWTRLQKNIDQATTTTKGIVELATDGETAAGVVVQGSDARLANNEKTTNKDVNGGYVGRDANGFAELLGLILTGFLQTLSATHSQVHSTGPTAVTSLTFDRTAYGAAIVLFSARRGTSKAESGMLVISAPSGASPQVDAFRGTVGAAGLTWTAGLSIDSVSLQLTTDASDTDTTTVRYTTLLIPVP